MEGKGVGGFGVVSGLQSGRLKIFNKWIEV